MMLFFSSIGHDDVFEQYWHVKQQKNQRIMLTPDCLLDRTQAAWELEHGPVKAPETTLEVLQADLCSNVRLLSRHCIFWQVMYCLIRQEEAEGAVLAAAH